MPEYKSVDGVSMIRLTYVSTASDAINANDLKQILGQAQINNLRNGISGMLCFNSKVFLQTIEGSRARINNLYQALLKDKRHTNIQLLDTIEITVRDWSDWTMGYATPSKDNQSLFLKYSPSNDFNPYLLDANCAQLLLKDLASRVVKH